MTKTERKYVDACEVVRRAPYGRKGRALAAVRQACVKALKLGVRRRRAGK